MLEDLEDEGLSKSCPVQSLKMAISNGLVGDDG